MASKKVKILIATAAIIIVLAMLAIAVFHATAPEQDQIAKPFSFSLIATPNNGTVIQGGNTSLTVETTYLDGNASPITLSAMGGPNGTIYQFTNQTGIVTNVQPFRNNLTIAVPTSADSDLYVIKILALASNGIAQQVSFNLTVVNSQIQVSGNVTIYTQLDFSGTIMDIIPTHILFKSTTTSETYKAKIHRYTDTPVAPGKTGDYSISLPNMQSYRVDFYCFSYPHYIPVPREAISGIEDGYFEVNFGVDENATLANFTG